MNRENKPVTESSIITQSMEEVMHNSMMPYAEHVILERALPRVEDGLKPVQRRILYTMQELGLNPDKPHRKCARIVGDCLGKYHPHGDSSVYDALVRMAQDFSLRGILVDGHGNFGSIDGDSAAAMRYTEARMAPLALEMLRDIQKDTVPFRLNFDDTLKEPDVLPARYPNLLVNGASGIAVGLATNIPTHNLGETINATMRLIDNPDAELEELMEVLPAPDFPTGGILLDTPEIKEAYRTGRGKLTLRARVHFEKGKAGRSLIVIDEIPYQINKAQMLEKILKLSEDKKAALGGIHDIRDESDRTGMRAVIEVKKDADPELILGYLYKYSDLQVTFGVNMVVIADGKPMQMGLKEVLTSYIGHQKNVLTRRTEFELEQAKARAHILEGLIIAVDNLDEVLKIIRSSKNGREAKTRLIERFGFTDIQAQAILDLRLQRLTGLEILELRREFEEIKKLIDRLEGILKSEKKLLNLIKTELGDIRDRFPDQRRTEIQKENRELVEAVLQDEQPVPEETVVLYTRGGFIKRLSPRAYEKMELPADEADMPQWTLRTMSDHTLLILTDIGSCFKLDVSQLDESTRPKDRGLTLPGLLAGLEKGETAVALFEVGREDLSSVPDLLFFTEKGMVKRSAAVEYDIRRSHFAAIRLGKGDKVIRVVPDTAGGDLYCLSRDGMMIRFSGDEVPQMGRVTQGVSAMKLAVGDRVIDAGEIQNGDHVLIVTDRGYVKRMPAQVADVQKRAGKGSRAFPFQKNKTTGAVIAGGAVLHEERSFSVLQKQGEITTLRLDMLNAQGMQDKGMPLVLALMDNVVTALIL